MSDLELMTALAARELPPEVAARWVSLLRPAVRLAAHDGTSPVVARLGGHPRLPVDLPWPVWEGHGPLCHIGEVDLGALARCELDAGIKLPSSGRLVAFYFDGSYDDFAGVVGTWDVESLAGARLFHVPEDAADVAERPAPEGVTVFDERALTGRQVTTFPTWEHPALRRTFGEPGQDIRRWLGHPVNAQPFTEALWTLQGDGPLHQLGGWANPDQGPVEVEVAQAALGLDPSQGGREVEDEALRWSLLLQVDSDGEDMMWGDVGKLYWLARSEDLEAGDLGGVSFTWQCG